MSKKLIKHHLDKDYIVKTISFKYRTISAFLREYKISRTRFYEILNAEYVKKDAPAVNALCEFLSLPKHLAWEN